MKKVTLILLLAVSPLGSYSQVEKEISFSKVPPKCNCGCFKQAIGLIDFQSGSVNPIETYICSDYGDLIIKKVAGFTGLYTVESPFIPFDADRTFISFQSEASLWREVQASVQPDGKIYINAYQNGVATNIVTQNVSFQIITSY
jgi:hypothetical protein